jgi:signal transduction histidine kinase
MSEAAERPSAPSDPKGRVISIFVGAVLLPSIALSVFSFDAVPKHAENIKITLKKQADTMLYYIDKDLEIMARTRALTAARAVGPEKLLEGHPGPIKAALLQSSIGDNVFETLRLEASSPVALLPKPLAGGADDVRILREAMKSFPPPPGPDGEDSVPLTTGDGSPLGLLRFRYSCSYAHGTMVRDYFENEFVNPNQAFVIRVTEPEGALLYETGPTPDDKFEVTRVMAGTSFQGLKLHLRNKDRSIEREVRRWAIGKAALIGFVDLLMLGGLYLIYTNVKREVHLARLKSDFVANVSHELKTPLALIRLFAETLELGRVANSERAQQYYRVINKESQRLTQLINNILDFSRIEAGRKQYRMAPVDVGRIVEEVLEAYGYPIEQQGFELQAVIADDLPVVQGDAEALSQALLNLLNNAIKYSRDEKFVKVEAKREGDRVLLSVTDKGIGVAKADQRKIFEKFYRAEDSLVHETKGSGLGLALVSHIMDAHGGSVEVHSAPMKGSTFTLALPVTRARAAAPAPSAVPAQTHSNRNADGSA